MLYEERDDSSTCDFYDLEPGAVTLTNVKDCSTAAVEAVTAQAVDLTSAVGQQTTLGGTTAEQLTDVAAVGSVVASDLMLPSAEECLAACALWIPDCTHVSLGTQLLPSAEHPELDTTRREVQPWRTMILSFAYLPPSPSELFIEGTAVCTMQLHYYSCGKA